jgi:hypothetical protein
MTPIDPAAIRKLCEGITAAPWIVAYSYQDDRRVVGILGPPEIVDNGDGPEPLENVIVETDGGYYPPRKSDAEFIAAARSLVPALLAEVERLRALLSEACDIIQIVSDHGAKPYTVDVIADIRRKGGVK